MHVDITPNKFFEFHQLFGTIYICKNIIRKVDLPLFLHSSNVAQLIARYSRLLVF